MKRFLSFVWFVIMSFCLLMLTTLLFDVEFINKYFIRQLLVYFLIVFEIYIIAKLYIIKLRE